MLGRTVKELHQTMDSAEYAEWLALLLVQPWGGYRLDRIASFLARATLQPWTSQASGSDWARLLEYGDPPPPDENYELPSFEALQARLIAMGGKKPDGQS